FRRDDNRTPSDPSDDLWIEAAKLTASGATTGNEFGTAVSISGDRAIVGAPASGPGGGGRGSAYVFRRDDRGTPSDPTDDTWTEEAKLTASDGVAGDWFGVSVSISGNRAVIGASFNVYTSPSANGSAYVFRRDDNDTPLDPSDDNWVEEDKLTSPDATRGDWYGLSVSISGDYAVVGAAFDDPAVGPSGSAYLYRRHGSDPNYGTWVEQTKLTASDAALHDYFGFSVAISGDWAIVGSLWDDEEGDRSGSAYCFRRDDNGTPLYPNDDSWVEAQKLTALDAAAKDNFGNAVSISDRWAIVGAERNDDACSGDSSCDSGSAYVYRCEDNGTPLDPSDDFWIHQAKYTASDGLEGDALGLSVSISSDTALVGAARSDDAGTTPVPPTSSGSAPTTPRTAPATGSRMSASRTATRTARLTIATSPMR
ncbi:MAG: FG-GAP repeat protein, partial [Planctomycetota bacterium]